MVGNISDEWTLAKTADVNADGAKDIVWQNSNTGEVVVWQMHGVDPIEAIALGGDKPDWQIL